MLFLYPRSRHFPFDEVCEQIVRELEKRNWSVPGMDVSFEVYGSGEQKMTYVGKIKGDDFQIRFGRPQALLPGGRYNDVSAASTIHIPHKELHVYNDESGPTFYLYVGSDWEKDREDFFNGSKVNSKLRGRPRTYLQYTGGCNCRTIAGAAFEAVGLLSAMITRDAQTLARMTHTHSGRRSPLLVHTNDLNREYDPEGKEPALFKTANVMDEFRQYLSDVVLCSILAQPISSERIELLAPPATPFPTSIGPIFCFAEHRDVDRIERGKTDASELLPADRYAMSGGGYRLMPLSTSDDGTVPEISYEGFLWCGIGKVTPETDIEALEVFGHHRWPDREQFVLRLTPKSSESIYVADHAAYEKRRQELSDIAEKEGRRRFTDEEVADFVRARARTIVPIAEYKGDFEKPVVLVTRELAFEEVEVVSGPHKSRSFMSAFERTFRNVKLSWTERRKLAESKGYRLHRVRRGCRERKQLVGITCWNPLTKHRIFVSI